MSGAKAAKAALFAACQALFAEPVHVTYGPAGRFVADDMLELLDVRSDQDPATMGPRRSREETLLLDGQFSCYRGGGDEVQQLVSERAWDLLGLLEAYLQDVGVLPSTQITLSGAVREARVISHELTETNQNPDGATVEGRYAYLSFTVQAKTRV